MKVFLIISLLCLQPYVFSESILSRLKSFVVSKVGKKSEIDKKNSYTLPQIPQLKKSQTNLDIYSKNLSILNNGKKYGSLDFEKKKKYEQSFLLEIYKKTRMIYPTKKEMQQWLNVLKQGGTREGIYHALILDNIYHSLEESNKMLKEKEIESVILFCKRYLNFNINAMTLKKTGFFTLKRVIVERALSVVDSFTLTQEDVYLWYAILSSELAYKIDFKKNHRKNKEVKFHLNWSKNVPIQHLKSELILKLHIWFNEKIQE